MSGVEGGRPSSGRKILTISLIAGMIGIAPLLLYVAFGPSDGNPVGLGLLAALAVPIAGIGILVGLVKLLLEKASGSQG
jgi:hypothetical protein